MSPRHDDEPIYVDVYDSNRHGIMDRKFVKRQLLTRYNVIGGMEAEILGHISPVRLYL